jgi:23S rRNA G2069 N7-methylase RlmK/C1962 C5-methylase RlmI
MNDFERAWSWREKEGVLAELDSIRVFHGPGEGSGAFSRIAIDRFKSEEGESHFWITEWAEGKSAALSQANLSMLRKFLESKKAASAVALLRPSSGLPSEPTTILGEPPEEAFTAREGARDSFRFLIRLRGVRHPGLFLDHRPLRLWLRKQMKGLRVLNTFSYTGSLSIAAGAGGAAEVTTLDLSKATIDWARENWKLNGFDEDRARFIYGDYFDWLPRLKKEGKKYDCVVLDPPSFSRGKSGTFSTAKDLVKLHRLAFDVIEPGGYLVTSINSANVSIDKFAKDVFAAAPKGRMMETVRDIELPETFPTREGRDEDRYLKGWILRIS